MPPANKYFKYAVAASVLTIVVAGLVLGVPGDCVPFWVAIIVLNGVFFIFSTGWRRWICLGFVVLGLFLLKGEIAGKSAWKMKHEKLLEQINAKWGKRGATNSTPGTLTNRAVNPKADPSTSTNGVSQP